MRATGLPQNRLSRRDRRRKIRSLVMQGVLIGAGVLAVLPLLSVFLYVLQKGLGGVNFAFFTALPNPVG